MAPPYCIPIQAYALISACVLTTALVVIVLFWLGAKEPVQRRILLRRRAVVVALGLIIISTSTVAALYECSTYGICAHCGYWLTWTLTDSSGGFTMNDFQITVNYTWDDYLEVERAGGSIIIDGMNHNRIYSISLICERTPIFSGMNNVTMKAYTARGYFILLYVNSTGYPSLFTNEHGLRDNTYHFENGAEWVDIQVYVGETVE